MSVTDPRTCDECDDPETFDSDGYSEFVQYRDKVTKAPDRFLCLPCMAHILGPVSFTTTPVVPNG